MSAFYNIMLGYFFGFALGVGCALAVFYAIYSGGYRKAVEDWLLIKSRSAIWKRRPPRTGVRKKGKLSGEGLRHPLSMKQ